MCGILGSVNFPFEKNILDSLRHRGPDFGQIKNFQVENNTIHFGHRRLSIVDLSPSGNQPLTTEDSNFSIVFNGEIYNHQVLREDLSEIVFNGHSDTETILEYLKKFGIKAVKKFNGIFSFALLDKKNEKLYLARDPYGVKPLYFFRGKDQLIFSSEIRPIKKMIKVSLNHESLAELLKLRYTPSSDSLYHEIQKLLPGHYLEYDLNNHQIKLTSFIPPNPPKKEFNFNQALYAYGDLFEKAVKRQLMADVEIGVLLSGGVDSALVTHFAAKNTSTKIKTFTVGFEEEDEANELVDARESAQFLGTDHHEIIINQNDFGSHFETVVQIIEEPLATTSSIPMYFLNKEVAKYVKVVLTGQGADEPLCGYNRYKGEIYRNHIPTFMSNLNPLLLSRVKNEKFRRFFQSYSEKDIIKRFEKTYTLFQEEQIQSLIGRTESKSYQKIKYFYEILEGSQLHPAEAMMLIDMKMNLADDLLLYTDKISMHFGIEARVPFLDHELTAFIHSLPFKYKFHHGKGKRIHKEFAKSVLPEKIVNRKKKGFQSPTKKWFDQHFGKKIMDLTVEVNAENNPLFDTNAMNQILLKHQKGFNQEKELFLMLSLLYWFKNEKFTANKIEI